MTSQQVFTFIVDNSRWEFLSNFCMEQEVTGYSNGVHVGPALPFRLATNYRLGSTEVRYIVDWFGRIWYSIAEEGYAPKPLSSPSKHVCLMELAEVGADCQEIEALVKKAQKIIKKREDNVENGG